jgi:hypothetical protein
VSAGPQAKVSVETHHWVFDLDGGTRGLDELTAGDDGQTLLDGLSRLGAGDRLPGLSAGRGSGETLSVDVVEDGGRHVG